MLICLGFQSIMIPFSCSIFLNHENYKKLLIIKRSLRSLKEKAIFLNRQMTHIFSFNFQALL